MKRIGFLLKVKSDKIDEYKAHHQNVWPEMRAALQRQGWHNYSLFMRPDGLVFGYFETPESLEAAQAGMAQEAINDRWQEFMAPFFEGLGDTHADQMMEVLEPIFFLE
jgi:L-rhamnose mutarotase